MLVGAVGRCQGLEGVQEQQRAQGSEAHTATELWNFGRFLDGTANPDGFGRRE